MSPNQTTRLDTRLASEAAEFLVLANLLLERISAYKTYTNMPGYDLVATDPGQNTSAKIQVKSRWRTDAPGFPIRNFDCDFVVFCRLNRGNRKGTAEVRAPEFYVFPVEVVRQAWNPQDPWGKVMVNRIDGWRQYLNGWNRIRDFLAPGRRSGSPEQADPGEAGSDAAARADLGTAGRRISIVEFRSRVQALDGERLETLKRRRAFRVHVLDGGLEITPESSGRARPVSWKRIEDVLARHDEIRSLNPADYHDITFHSSYLLAILRRLLG